MVTSNRRSPRESFVSRIIRKITSRRRKPRVRRKRIRVPIEQVQEQGPTRAQLRREARVQRRHESQIRKEQAKARKAQARAKKAEARAERSAAKAARKASSRSSLSTDSGSASKSSSDKKKSGTASGGPGFFGRSLQILTISLMIATLFLGVWLMQLDREVRAAFVGDRWALPAHTYARPMELYPGKRLTRATLLAELEQLGYRKLPAAREPGSYSVADTRVALVTRRFAFSDALRESQRLVVTFGNGVVASITGADGGQINVIRLEPAALGSAKGGEHQDRKLVKLAEVPPALIDTLLIIEDRAFFSHIGINLRGILRAAFVNAKARRVLQGGSTITQQLVKTFYLDSRRTIGRKVKEAAMAVLLERHYSKEQILQAYLNEVYMGQAGSRAIHGFGLASEFYFARPLGELSLPEISTLVAMVRGPSLYDPRRRPERAKARRDLVLTQLAAAAPLTTAELESLKAVPIKVTGRGRVDTTHPAFDQYVRRQLKVDYKTDSAGAEGLTVFTTLDPSVQRVAEKALGAGLASIEKARNIEPGTLEGAVVVVRIDNGEVLAAVGGRKAGFEGFNRALDARRPIGSLVKPAVYLTAIERSRQYTLATPIVDGEFSVKMRTGQIWSPQNYDKVAHGNVSLLEALSRSYNLATARLGLDVGVENVRDTLNRLGLPGEIPAYPSILLGAVDATPMEVAQMYQTIGNAGFKIPLRALRGVRDRAGRTLNRNRLAVEQIANGSSMYLLDHALREVLLTGTGSSLGSRFSPSLGLAGKTGTTDDFRDSWFAGYSKENVIVVWVGRDDNEPTGLTGASGALRIWADVVGSLGTGVRDNPPPTDVHLLAIDPGTGLLGDQNCAGVRQLPFLLGTGPAQAAPCAGFTVSRPIANNNPLTRIFRPFSRNGDTRSEQVRQPVNQRLNGRGGLQESIEDSNR